MTLRWHSNGLNLRFAATMRVQNHRFCRDTHRDRVTDLLDKVADDCCR